MEGGGVVVVRVRREGGLGEGGGSMGDRVAGVK